MQEASAPPENTSLTWGQRVGVLSGVQQWDMDALIAIRNYSKNGSGSANLKWQQQSPQRYSMLFYGPMGSGSQKLIGRPGKVTLESADGKIFTASSPEALLAEQTGWRLPVSSLYYWVRGMPVPHYPSSKRFDSYERIAELEQQGWLIQYLGYTSVNHVDVPAKILLANSQMSVKIIIRQWTFS